MKTYPRLPKPAEKVPEQKYDGAVLDRAFSIEDLDAEKDHHEINRQKLLREILERHDGNGDTFRDIGASLCNKPPGWKKVGDSKTLGHARVEVLYNEAKEKVQVAAIALKHGLPARSRLPDTLTTRVYEHAGLAYLYKNKTLGIRDITPEELESLMDTALAPKAKGYNSHPESYGRQRIAYRLCVIEGMPRKNAWKLVGYNTHGAMVSALARAKDDMAAVLKNRHTLVPQRLQGPRQTAPRQEQSPPIPKKHPDPRPK